MQTRTIPITDDAYPSQVKEWFEGQTAPTLYTSGNQDIFTQPQNIQIALFAGRECPGSLLLPAMDMAATLRGNKYTVISGFHSPLEQECLQVLLRGEQPVIACPARSIQSMRPLQPWKQPYQNDRLLVLSPFPEGKKRMNTTLAKQRNQLVVAMAKEMLIIHASASSKIVSLAEDVLKKNRRVFAIDAPENEHLFKVGILPWMPENRGESVAKLSDLL